MLFEVCVESADGVLAAVAAGADRVELCAALDVGGLTPSASLIEWASSRTVAHVLIRPRPGDFVYTPDEAGIMLRDIAAARSLGAAGIVIGALTPSGAVDVGLCSRLVAAARPASITFHRAFDAAADPRSAFDDVLALGVDRLLTSGAAPSALSGAELLADLVRASGQLTILPGGGVTEETAPDIIRRTGARELHFSARNSGRPDAPLRTRIERIMTAARSVSDN
jgi:copper homeostasis protein